MKIVAIIQARIGSLRLPGKVLRNLNGTSAIELMLRRLNRSELLDEICVAIPDSTENDILCSRVASLGFRVIRGSETDVLSRYWIAANATSADTILRLTGDCPFIDPAIVDKAIRKFLAANVDYVSEY